MTEETVNIPMNTDLSPMTILTAAKQFESLTITGVLFVIVVVLTIIIVYKTKDNEKIKELTARISSQESVSKETVQILQQLNNSNNALIMQKLDNLLERISKIEDNLWEVSKR